MASQYSSLIQALDLDRNFLIKRIKELEQALSVCNDLLQEINSSHSFAAHDITVPVSVAATQKVFTATVGSVKYFDNNLTKELRFTRMDYYQDVVTYLARHGSSAPRNILSHFHKELNKKISRHGLSGFLSREISHFSKVSKITKDPSKPGNYMLKAGK